MQNKGLIITFAVLFGLVSIYQLSFTYITNKVEGDAEAYAQSKYPANEPEKREEAEARYLDSIANIPVMWGVDYKTATEKELNKGLDLKGGINVILRVSVEDILKSLANHTKDPAFNQALADARELQKGSQDTYVESFFKAFENLPGENELATPDIFYNKNLEDDIKPGMTNAQVRTVIDRKIDESINSAFEVLRKRIDKFGVTQPNIQRLGNSGRILVELPGAKDVDRIRNLLQSTAQLEFWDVYKFEEVAAFLEAADTRAGEIAMAKQGTSSDVVEEESAPVEEEQAEEQEEATEEDDDISELLGGEDVQDIMEGEDDAAHPILSKMVSLGYSTLR